MPPTPAPAPAVGGRMSGCADALSTRPNHAGIMGKPPPHCPGYGDDGPRELGARINTPDGGRPRGLPGLGAVECLPPRPRPGPRGPPGVGSQTHAPGGGLPRGALDMGVQGSHPPRPRPGDDGPWEWEYGPTTRGEDAHGSRPAWMP